MFGVAVFIINSQPEQQPFQSVELGIAEVSPLGASGGYAIPASGNSITVFVPGAKISDTKSPTYWEEEFKIWFGPKTSKDHQRADVCELYRKSPNGNNWDRIETAGAGNTKSKNQSLAGWGTWRYRAHCGVTVNMCSVSDSTFDGLHSYLVTPKVLGLNFAVPHAEAAGCYQTAWGEWAYLSHPVVPRPPVAAISQNKAVTEPNENFWLHFGQKTTGWTGGNADKCVLQRKTPNQVDWVGIDENGGGTANRQYSPAALGTWKYRTRCSNDGGNSAWVSLDHLVTNDADAPTAQIEVRNITLDDSWTSDDITIASGDQIELRWESTNASSCSGGNFATGGLTSGTDSNVTEPAANASLPYTVSCTGSNGNATDVLVVTAGEGVVGEVTVDPSIVRKGDSVTVTWTGASAACSLTGPGVSMAALADSSGSTSVVVNGESTFTLTCPGGTDTATVKVLPVIQET